MQVPAKALAPVHVEPGNVGEVVNVARNQCQPVFNCRGGDHQVMSPTVSAHTAAAHRLANASASLHHRLIEVKNWDSGYECAKPSDTVLAGGHAGVPRKASLYVMMLMNAGSADSLDSNSIAAASSLR